MEFSKEIGVLTALIVYTSGKQILCEVKLFTRECSITLSILEESTQWENLDKETLNSSNKLFVKNFPSSLMYH